MIRYDSPQDISALDAKFEAQKIAFAPLAYNAVSSLINLGILQEVSNSRKECSTIVAISEKVNVSEYGVGVLLDMGLSMGLFWKKEDYEM